MAVLTHEQWLVHKQRIRRFDRLERENKRLQTEVRRLRERLDALASEFEKEAAFAYSGWQREKDDYLEGVYRAFRHAAEKVRALAERGVQGG